MRAVGSIFSYYKDYKNKPLTFKAFATSTIKINLSNLKYSINNGSWASYTNNNTINLAKDDIVSFSSYILSDIGAISFTTTGKLEVFGNPKYLTNNTIGSNGFKYLFKDCKNIVDASKLVLPDMDLTQSSCYANMFQGCTSLTAAPMLPATGLVQSCYAHMFYGCTALSTAPYLPATTLPTTCYYAMFSGCTALNLISVAFTAWDVNSAQGSWVDGVGANGTFIKPTNLAIKYGPFYIPEGWTVKNKTSYN